jgi:pilus assembly protein CpaE
LSAVVPLRADRPPPPSPRKLGNIAAFALDDDARAGISALLDVVAPGSAVRSGGIDDATRWVARDPSARMLIVDLTGAGDPIQALDRLAEVCLPGTQVIAIGDINDIQFYRTVKSAGVIDYLVKPVAPDALRAALEATAAEQPPPILTETPAAGKDIVGVIGARGGVGATMVAISLAWHFAERSRQRTVLVDLDLSCGSAGLALDMEPGHGLADALANPDRIDGLLIASATVKIGDNFYLLSSEQSLDDPAPPRAEAVKPLIASLRQGFQRTVVEVPRHAPRVLFEALDKAGTLVIVTDLSLAGARDTARLLRLAESTAPYARRIVVANRVGMAKKGELSRQEVEKALGIRFAAVIPEDSATVAGALNAGKPVTVSAPTSPVTNELRALAELIEGDDPKPAERGLLSRLSWKKSPGGQS